MKFLVLAGALWTCVFAQPTISTIAGTGVQGFGGDGGPATAAQLNLAVYVHYDVFGNLYIADEGNQRIRKVDRAGIITTFAGTGAAGFSGDGGPATSAQLRNPNGLCSDSSGNIYINDTLNQRVRRVDRSGIITTFAGSGAASTSGDGGPATSAGIWLPIRCDFDSQNRMVLIEQGGHRIRRIAGGTITTIAGTGVTGFSGDGGQATAAQLNNPTSVAIDANDNIYFSDQSNHRIRRITSAGVISTYAGNGAAQYAGEGVPATSASLYFPGGLAVDQRGTLYMAESISFRIRRITPDGTISTIAGTGVRGSAGDGGPATSAMVNEPFGIDVAPTGNIVFADTLNNRVRNISPVPLGTPSFTSAGTTNAASFQSGITPGGLATVFGQNLSSANGVVVTNQIPWPASLAGVSVSVGGVAARLYSLVVVNGQEQISFQTPFGTAQGPVNLQVNNNGSVFSTSVQNLAAQPGVFEIGNGNGAFLDLNYQVIGASNPASRGEILAVYLTGLGEVAPTVAVGELAPAAEPLPRTTINPTVTVDGRTADILYSGLAPGLIGLYQINFRVPNETALGSVDFVVTSNGVAGKTVKLQVQ